MTDEAEKIFLNFPKYPADDREKLVAICREAIDTAVFTAEPALPFIVDHSWLAILTYQRDPDLVAKAEDILGDTVQRANRHLVLMQSAKDLMQEGTPAQASVIVKFAKQIQEDLQFCRNRLSYLMAQLMYGTDSPLFDGFPERAEMVYSKLNKLESYAQLFINAERKVQKEVEATFDVQAAAIDSLVDTTEREEQLEQEKAARQRREEIERDADLHAAMRIWDEDTTATPKTPIQITPTSEFRTTYRSIIDEIHRQELRGDFVHRHKGKAKRQHKLVPTVVPCFNSRKLRRQRTAV